MQTYAVLGATGTIGGLVLRRILESTSCDIRCFVRSKKKLLQQCSDLLQDDDLPPRITTYEGDMSNSDTLQGCINGTNIVFLCAAASLNTPGCKIAQDQAQAVIAALRSIKSETPNIKLPKLVMLSSAETEEKFNREYNWVLRTILYNANSNIYDDLIAAERYLRDHDDLVSTVCVKAGGLSHDIRRGHVVSEDESQTFLSFLDLAAGMVEVADTAVQGEKWDAKTVSVLSPGGKAKIAFSSVPLLFRGLLVHYFPWIYSYIS